MEIQKQIEEKENQLYEFIIKKNIKTIEMFCQWNLHMDLVKQMQDDEEKLMMEKLYPIILDFLEKDAPLHFSTLHMNPISSITYDCSKRTEYDYYCRESSGKNREVCYWSEITYIEFEEAGFNRDFTKRILEKLINSKKIRFKKGVGRGHKYFVFDPYILFDKIDYKKRGVKFLQYKMIFTEDESWIYGHFNDASLETAYNFYKKIYFDKIIEGKELKDDVAQENEQKYSNCSK